MPRVFSGMRPTGKLHLGHLAGALYNWKALQEQEQNECFYCIVDWHALMTDYADPRMVQQNCTEVFLDWLGAGIDPEKSVVFIQSHVPEHAELHLAFSMITPLGWLERNPTYKEQKQNINYKDLNNYAFLGYPVLQAADILIYKGEKVPVGEDQSAHLELSREIARRFNNFYGPVFPEPETILTPTPKVPGTDGRKMSKSYDNSITISDEPEMLWDKLRTMKTDPARMRKTDVGDPAKCPVWDIHLVFNKNEEERAELDHGCRTAGIGCIECKKKLNGHILEVLKPIQERRATFAKDPAKLQELLLLGATKARKVGSQTMKEVVDAMGLIRGSFR